MISLTAHLRPAHEAGSDVIRHVSARLRSFDHVECAAGQLLALIPEVGSALITETRRELVVNIAMDTEDAAARASAALLRELMAAVGDRVLAEHLAISWTREQFVPAALR